MERPVFLNLFQIKFPLTAIVSITHRVTGVVIFLAIPYCLYLLEMSLKSSSSWNSLSNEILSQGQHKLYLWAVFSAIVFHIFAGIRHIIMDFGYLEERKKATVTSGVCFVLSILASLGFGVYVC